jgi:CheY-like chemotaxis protein
VEAVLTPHLLRNLSLLLVEDDAVLAGVMTRWVHWLGATLDTAGLGAAALSMAAEKKYDVVLLDLSLPDMKGEEVYAGLVKARPDLASRVIILTGGATNKEAKAFLRSTHCPVVLKPFELENLARQIVTLNRAA